MTKEDIKKVFDVLYELVCERLTTTANNTATAEQVEYKHSFREPVDYSDNENYKEFREQVKKVMRERNLDNNTMRKFIIIYTNIQEPNLAYIEPGKYQDFIDTLINKVNVKE